VASRSAACTYASSATIGIPFAARSDTPIGTAATGAGAAGGDDSTIGASLGGAEADGSDGGTCDVPGWSGASGFVHAGRPLPPIHTAPDPAAIC
jgi:hypothetical protein